MGRGGHGRPGHRKLNAVYAKGIRTIVDPTVWGWAATSRGSSGSRRRPRSTSSSPPACTSYEELPQQYAYRGPGLLIDIPEPMVTDFSRDITEGIADTGVKAAFLKFALETPEPSPGVERIARAIARDPRRDRRAHHRAHLGPAPDRPDAVRIFPRRASTSPRW